MLKVQRFVFKFISKKKCSHTHLREKKNVSVLVK